MVNTVYFIDDSKEEFRNSLREVLKACIQNSCPNASIVEVIDNVSIYHAVNRAWEQVVDDYAISFHNDFRMIQMLPLDVVRRAFEKYLDVYLIYLRVRWVFGYNDAAKKELRKYSWYADCPDDELEVWYYHDENKGRFYSAPYRIYLGQKLGIVPKVHWGGVELMPRKIDESNTLWTPKLPPKYLPTWPGHENFAGGPVILRTEVIKNYLPLPIKYSNRPAADCQETYFWTTDIDFKYYTAYLNLQAFAVQFGDQRRSLQDVEPKYWHAFRERNSKPVTYKGSTEKIERHLRCLRILHCLLLSRHRITFVRAIKAYSSRVWNFLRKPWREKLATFKRHFMGGHIN